MSTEHRFEADVRWTPTEESPLNIEARAPDRPPIQVSAAPAYRGDPSRTNPEELLAIAVSSCQLLTYLALARRAGITVTSYHDRPIAVLATRDRRLRITEIHLAPRIGLAAGGDLSRAQALVEEAHAHCFIANSVSGEVRIAASFEVARATAA